MHWLCTSTLAFPVGVDVYKGMCKVSPRLGLCAMHWLYVGIPCCGVDVHKGMCKVSPRLGLWFSTVDFPQMYRFVTQDQRLKHLETGAVGRVQAVQTKNKTMIYSATSTT